MAMPRKRPLADQNQFYAYTWNLYGRVIYAGFGHNNRGRPTCKASWGGRSEKLLLVLKSFAKKIVVKVYPCSSRVAAIAKEKELIAKLKPKYNTNPSIGGRKGMHTAEGLKRISEANAGKKHTDEFKQKCRERMIGNQHLTGHKHTDETKSKISESNKGRPASELCKQKASERMKLRNTLNPPRKGKKCSEEHKRRLSEARQKYLQRKREENAHQDS